MLSQTASQTGKASFQLSSVLLLFSVIIITLKMNWTLSTSTFYHSDKTNAQLFGSRLKQWNILEKDIIASFHRNGQSDKATYYSMHGDLMYCSNIKN
jgi:hypothetical protein